ncbi:MAG: nucleotidyltransferase family protein [Candidatus Sulfotelmatobacter sp.]
MWCSRSHPLGLSYQVTRNRTAHISAVILAAGLSSRMGHVKQLIRLGGEPLLGHVIRTIREAGLHDLIAVLGFAAAEIMRDIPLEGIRVAINPAFAEGLAGSVRTGLAEVAAESHAALIFLADQPMVLTSTLALLVAKYQESRPSAVIPTYQGQRGNPVLLDRSLFAKAMELQGDEGFRRILQGLPNILWVEVDDPGVVLDVDTPEDLERCQALYRERSTRIAG